MQQYIAVIDMKAFYASVECVERNLNPFTTPLVVCDQERGEGTIVLSVSPYLKSMGIPSRCRKRELPQIDGLIYATPQMGLYVKKSAEIVSIILDFVGEDDIHVYSIDELFVNLGPYLKMYDCTPYQLVRKIQNTIFEKTRLISTAGLSYNMLMAKLALDLDGKKKPPYIAWWKKEDVKNKLWKVTPLTKMWGISAGYERKLNNLGIYTVGDLANSNKQLLKAKLGIMGEQLWEHANGIDDTNIRDKYIPENTSFSIGQCLIRDYTKDEARLILREMNDDLAMRLREHGLMASQVSLTIIYTYALNNGFTHQAKLDFSTDDTDQLLDDLNRLYDKYCEDLPIRRLYISYGLLTQKGGDQLSLFEDPEEEEKRKSLQLVSDELKRKYGKNIVLRMSSLLEESTAKERHSQIGGHRK